MFILWVAGSALAILAANALYIFFNWLQRLNRDLLHPVPAILEDPNSFAPVPAPSVFASPSKSLSVVVPAYNEQDRLPVAMNELFSYLQRRRDHQGPLFTYEVIIVDDGSTDQTVRVGYDFVHKHGFDAVRVLRIPVNMGKAHAVRAGMLIARGELCLMMDGDGATRVSEVEKLEEAISKNKLEDLGGGKVVQQGGSDFSGPLAASFGSRAHLQDAALAKRTALRNFLMWGFHMCVRFVAGDQIKDTQCGFKLFTRRAAALVFSNQRLQRWAFDVELIHLAQRFKIPISEVQVDWTEIPGSKMVKIISILTIFMELVALKVAYQILGLWRVYSEGELPIQAL